MTRKTDKSTQVFPTHNYNTRLAELIGKMSESGEIAEEEVDPEITFKNTNTTNKPSFTLNWNVVKESPDIKEGENKVAEEVEAFTAVFLARGQSELDIKRCGVCNGTSGTNDLLEWLRRLDTVAKPIEVATATATGPLARFLLKNKEAHADWPSLRASIAAHFISSCIRQTQKDALLRIEQRSSESLVAFNYEFESLLTEAYNELPTDQTDLIRTYLSALKDRKLAIAVLHENPTSVEQAMRLAFKKNQSNDFLRPQSSSTTDKFGPVESQLSALTKAVNGLAKAQEQIGCKVADMQTAAAHAPAITSKQTKEKLICYRCGKPGHFARDCRSERVVPREDARPNDLTASFNAEGSPKPAIKKCLRCRNPQHEVKNCKTGPPKKPCFCGGLHWVYDCPHRRPDAQTSPQTEN